MVEDMKKNGKDPLWYFESHQEQMSDILNMSFKKATLLAQQYKANMEQCGQLTVPKDGGMMTPIDGKLSEETQKQQTKAAEANLIQFLSCFCTSNNKSQTIRVQSHISDMPTLVCMARGVLLFCGRATRNHLQTQHQVTYSSFQWVNTSFG
jgi:hypothetical protein